MARRIRHRGKGKRPGKIRRKSLGVWGGVEEEIGMGREYSTHKGRGHYKKPLTFHKEGINPRR